MIRFIILGLLLMASVCVQGQLTKELTYNVESAVTLSDGDATPLWLNANKHGMSSLEKQNGYIRVGVFCPFEAGKEFSYSYGIDMVGAVNFDSNVTIQQAYLDLSYKKILLSIGSKERKGELLNNNLSSGALVLSENARPIPQVWIGLPNYINVPLTNGWLSFRGHIAYGRFADDAWQRSFVRNGGDRTENVLYHSKALYIKLGDKPTSPLIFEGGIQMEDQFSGDSYKNGKVISMPSNLKAYWKAFIPAAGGNNTPLGEQLNIEGNMLGSWHASLACKLPQGYKLRGYYEHYFEDHSMLFFKYPWKDALIGVELTFPKNQFVDAMVYENIGSKYQSGAFSWWGLVNYPKMDVYGIDDYYNNAIYNAWQHAGQALGNPLFKSPIYNKDRTVHFTNNRLIAHHVGIEGTPTSELHYKLLLSYSSNWGTYSIPFDEIKYNTSTLAEVSYRPTAWRGWNFTGAVAFDRGTLYGNNIGGMFKVSKTGLLNNKKRK